ncbi:MAG: Transglycosylase domain protein, partial [Frankiales bacterium]|nr:Transglycosylase domain protein [Frankiales bacterium]
MTSPPGSDRGLSFFAGWPESGGDRPVAPSQPAGAATGPMNRPVTGSGNSRPPRLKRWAVRAIALGTVGAAGIVTTLTLTAGTASADPSANSWLRLRQCESGNNYAINTGNDHYGAYQFDLSTWRSVGGSGYPNNASAAEQDARALILYRQRGWQPWQCASIVGLREDGDARSGRTSDITVAKPATAPKASSGIPAFPGLRWFHEGDWNASIKRFQDRMHARGFFPVGTGQYGPNTLAMVKRLQSQNGLVPNGEIGPNTW